MRRMTVALAACLILCGCGSVDAAQAARLAVDERTSGGNVWHVSSVDGFTQTGTISMGCSSQSGDMECQLYDVPFVLSYDEDGTVTDFRLEPKEGMIYENPR